MSPPAYHTFGSQQGWIGVDLDRTLAYRTFGMSIQSIGAPIPAMRDRVRRWLDSGARVKIFTARVSSLHDDRVEQRDLISNWCLMHLGKRLEVTAEKDKFMLELWDDLAVRVGENTGQQLSQTRYGSMSVATLASDHGLHPESEHLLTDAHDSLSQIVTGAKGDQLTGYWHTLNLILIRLKIVLGQDQ